MINVMISGLPGNMSTECAKYLVRSDEFNLVGTAFSSDRHVGEGFEVDGEVVELLGRPDVRILQDTRDLYEDLLILDASKDSVVNDNLGVYCEVGVPSLILATGVTPESEQRVRDSDTISVIAPNALGEIVAFLSEVEDFSRGHEGRWVKDEKSGLYTRESHQGVDVPNDFEGKEKTSGTARQVVKYVNRMGLDYDESEINRIRDIEDQLRIGVPREHLKAHGHHRYKFFTFGKNRDIVDCLYGRMNRFIHTDPVFEGYTEEPERLSGERDEGTAIVSPDGSVTFRVEARKGETKLDHTVNGRGGYAEGALKYLIYAKDKDDAGIEGEVFEVIDTLRGR